jgi:hypothetical protein
MTQRLHAIAPDLAARRGVVIEQNDTAAVLRCGRSSSNARGSSAYDDDIRLLHRSVSTIMPSRQIN